MASVGVNLRASAYLHSGDRKYMEDEFVVAYQRTADKKDIEYSFFGIFDGHGGKEAAHFAKDHLMNNIVSQKDFWSDDDNDVLEAIREGFIQTHMAMWKVFETWPRTASGWPSTSGSTASVAFIRKQKIFIGHVGDSGICLGYEDDTGMWCGEHLTNDHKPESFAEKSRILSCGGKVVKKSGVPRIVWNRPKPGHKGPVRRSTPMDEIPFLAVARSLGDLWSYNPNNNQFVVSPVPDVRVYPIDISSHRCLIFGTDGLWNVMSGSMAVSTAYLVEKNNEKQYLGVNMPCGKQRLWINPSRSLVKGALLRYQQCRIRADNTSAVVVFLDPPGRPKREVLLQQKGLNLQQEEVASSSGAEVTEAKVQVCLYNHETKHNKELTSNRDGSQRKPHGLFWVQERLAEKWQYTSDSVDHGNPTSPVPRGLAAAREMLGKDLDTEQAPTPGSSVDKLTPSSPTPTTPSPLEASFPVPSPAASSSSCLSNMSHHCVLTPPPVPAAGAVALQTAASPSLRSTLRSSVLDNLASPQLPQQRRTSQPQRRTVDDGDAAADNNDKNTTLSATASVFVPAAAIPNKSLKRDREDDTSVQPFKKLCSECHSPTSPSSKLSPNHSVLQGEMRERTSCVDKSSDSCSSCSAGTHTVTSSPKSKLHKPTLDNQKSSKHNKDDIQIPLISSSTTTSNSRVPSSGTGIMGTQSTHFGKSLNRFKKSSRTIVHANEASENVDLNVGKKNNGIRRRTRSAIPTVKGDSTPTTVLFHNNNNTWSNEQAAEAKASTSRATSCRPMLTTIKTSIKTQDKLHHSTMKIKQGKLHSAFKIQQGKVLHSLSSTDSTSRVLKSVNRGSPSETKSTCSNMKTSESGMKSSKYAKSKHRRISVTGAPQPPVLKKSKMSVMVTPMSTATTMDSSHSLGSTVGKKSPKMLLRSDKSMITRSQEKRPK